MFNSIVGYLGWEPDTMDDAGDVFTSACLASIPEPGDETPIYQTLATDAPAVMTYRAYKASQNQPTLHASFSVLRASKHPIYGTGGSTHGVIFEKIAIERLALSVQ